MENKLSKITNRYLQIGGGKKPQNLVIDIYKLVVNILNVVKENREVLFFQQLPLK